MKQLLSIFVIISVFIFSSTEDNDTKYFELDDLSFEINSIYEIPIIYVGGCLCRISDNSFPILDSISYFLKLNNSLIIEVGSHTDYRGNDTMNMISSRFRSINVVNYLISEGVDKGQLTQQAYGESKPKITSEQDVQKFSYFTLGQELNEKYIQSLDSFELEEICHSLNRRTELRILEIKN